MSIDAPTALQLLKVARKYYLERVFELRELMQHEQDRFLCAASHHFPTTCKHD